MLLKISVRDGFLLKAMCSIVVHLVAAFPSFVFSGTPPVTVEFSPKLQKAYFEIQKLRINAARDIIENERSGEADNAFVPYLDNYADLHYLLISEDENAYKRLSTLENTRLDFIGRLPDNSPFKRFFQAEIRLHWAFAKLKFGNEISGSWEIIKAYRLLEENYKRFPQFQPTLKSLGLLHVLIGSIPGNYSWVAKVLGMKGDIQTGIREIQVVAEGNTIFQQEADLIDLLLHAYTLELSPAQQNKIRNWPKEQPDNLLLHFFATTVLMKEGKSEEADKYLSTSPTGAAYIPFPFLNYLRGEIDLQRGNYQDASENYKLFLRQYKGFNYLKDCNLKLFMSQWLAGNDRGAKMYLDKIGKSGKTIVEADVFATRFVADFEAGKISPAQKALFKARYATDGGYLKEASEIMQILSENSFQTVPEKAEYHYRLGRISQKSGQSLKAIPSFERVLTLPVQGAEGLCASSALQLGYIYLDLNQKQKAVANFKKSMSFKNHEYKNSIDNKARAALTKLGQ